MGNGESADILKTMKTKNKKKKKKKKREKQKRGQSAKPKTEPAKNPRS